MLRGEKYPDASRMRPGCVPDASRMRPGCVPDASRMFALKYRVRRDLNTEVSVFD